MNTQNSKAVSLNYARKNIIPLRPDGQPVSSSTCWRWNRKGLEGLEGERIKLEITYVGNRPMVTPRAIDDFFKAVTEAKLERHRRAEALAADVTDSELERAGLKGRDCDKQRRPKGHHRRQHRTLEVGNTDCLHCSQACANDSVRRAT